MDEVEAIMGALRAALEATESLGVVGVSKIEDADKAVLGVELESGSMYFVEVSEA